MSNYAFTQHSIKKGNNVYPSSYALVSEFKGRNSPVTKQPVSITLWRLFDKDTLIDKFVIVLESAWRREEIHDLTPHTAYDKFDRLKKWWEQRFAAQPHYEAVTLTDKEAFKQPERSKYDTQTVFRTSI